MENIANAHVNPRRTIKAIAPLSLCDMLLLLSDLVIFFDEPFNRTLNTNTKQIQLRIRMIPTGAKNAA